jgi:hypothetical protein
LLNSFSPHKYQTHSFKQIYRISTTWFPFSHLGFISPFYDRILYLFQWRYNLCNGGGVASGQSWVPRWKSRALPPMGMLNKMLVTYQEDGLWYRSFTILHSTGILIPYYFPVIRFSFVKLVQFRHY